MKLTLSQMPEALAQAMQQGAAVAGNGVIGSLQRAAAATGVDFGYLVKTAQRESSLNPNAHSPTSSATGLFQFVDQTWLGTLKASGAKHGYGGYADQIVKGRDGRYTVPNPEARRQVMSLRYNPDANAVMAAEMTADHAAYLKGRIGRDPSQGELYAAHFLGPDGAASLIQAADSRPGVQAAAMFPDAARSNRSIFYSHGRALNVAEVMANLTATGGAQPMNLPDAATDDTQTDNGNPLLMARLDKIKADEAMMQLVFGGNDQQGMLFNTQLLSAFGPDTADGAGDAGNDAGSDTGQGDAITKAFGGGNLLG